jgi:hypothetical protein
MRLFKKYSTVIIGVLLLSLVSCKKSDALEVIDDVTGFFKTCMYIVCAIPTLYFISLFFQKGDKDKRE